MHIHLLQWQLVGRQTLDVDGYMAVYQDAFDTEIDPDEFPSGLGYPGGAGPPSPYNTINTEGAIGGNPPLGLFAGPFIPANPEEMGWKDDVIVMPGQVTTFVVRVAPTDRPINAKPLQLMFPFDPSLGPGYVWHCHIVDHEDMSMMRPLMILPSPLRFPQIILQPKDLTKCIGAFFAQFNVIALSATQISYQWQVSTNNGKDWNDLKEEAPYTGTKTLLLRIKLIKAVLNNNLYRCKLTNIDGTTISNAAKLTVVDCSLTQLVQPETTDASTSITVDAVGSGVNPAAELQLSAYPNPAAESTTVTYNLPSDGNVTLGIFNAMGSLVRSIVKDTQTAGSYNVNVSLASLTKGTYFLKIQHTGTNTNSVVITLIKSN